MTDSMKFGPEWLRNMKSDTSGGLGGGSTPAPMVSAPIKMAEFRYGREEMLALFDRTILPPDPLKKMQGLFVEKPQLPLALIQMTEDETRMWNRGINSDAALRLSKPGVGVPGARGALGGRGGSVDSGRGWARGNYHYRGGLSYEDSDTPNGYASRGPVRGYDRSQSVNWTERNGGDLGDSPRKEFGRNLPDTNWRTSRPSDKWGRSNSNSWREGEGSDRPRPWEETNYSHPHPRRPWDNEESNLPEWATENPSESGGSFDASGAFHGGPVYSDEEESGTSSNHQRGLTKTEQAKASSSQPRPAPNHKKEPPNITNGTPNSACSSQETGGRDSQAAPLRQSHSATSLASERRHPSQPHPTTTAAPLSGINNHSSTLKETESKPKREQVHRRCSPSPHDQHPSITNLPKVVQVVHSEPKPLEKPSQEEEIEQRLLNEADVFVSRLMEDEERVPPPAPPTTTPPTGGLTDAVWYYQDPQGNVQGPFQSSEMLEWYSSGYFKGTLLVRRACDERYSPLSDLVKLWKGIPFNMDYYLVPPIKVSEPVLQTMEETFHQYQLRIMQQRQMYAKFNHSENVKSLSPLDKQQLIAHHAGLETMQANMMMPHPHAAANTNSNVLTFLQQFAQFQQSQQQQQRVVSQVPVQLPLPTTTEPQLDPVHFISQMGLQNSSRGAVSMTQNTPEDQNRFEQFMNAYKKRQSNLQPPTQVQPPQPVTMESVWGTATSTAAFPGWSVPPGHAGLPQTLWTDSITKGIKTEQEVLEEQLRVEEKKKEELRKQEELKRLKDEEEKEKERRKREEEEEIKIKRKEEEDREKEKKRIQEEEERRKKEAAKKAEQDRIRKEEEKKRKEEEKRRKEEEKRKVEEEKKRAEEERKKLEEEKKRREEMTKRQNEALKLLQEQQQARAVKPTPTPAPWTPPETSGASLADIQKTERKQQQQLREQQEMLKAFNEKHQQQQQLQLKNSKSASGLNLKWADSVNTQPARVKSLAEIQAEEQERLAKQAEKEKAERMAVSKEVPVAASVPWVNWNSTVPSVWGNTPNLVSTGGVRFFDDAGNKPPKQSKPTPQSQPQAKPQTKTKAKKEEATVMKLFEKQLPKTSKTDDFNKWCTKTLSAYSNSLDIPTFVDFLLAFESHKEVREYVRHYLGDNNEANGFASEFIDRRQRLLMNDQASHRPDPVQPSNHFQEVKGKNKKVKKSKMTKVDSRILGFNVTAAPDRINVGDRDYGESH